MRNFFPKEIETDDEKATCKIYYETYQAAREVATSGKHSLEARRRAAGIFSSPEKADSIEKIERFRNKLSFP